MASMSKKERHRTLAMALTAGTVAGMAGRSIERREG
jgi:hypothetical protein